MKKFALTIFMISVLFSCTSDVETDNLSKEDLKKSDSETSRELAFDCLNTSLVNEAVVNLGTVGGQNNVLRFSWDNTVSAFICESYGTHIQIERIPPYAPGDYFSKLVVINFFGTSSFDIAFDTLVNPYVTDSFRWRIVFVGKDCSIGVDCESVTAWHNFSL